MTILYKDYKLKTQAKFIFLQVLPHCHFQAGTGLTGTAQHLSVGPVMTDNIGTTSSIYLNKYQMTTPLDLQL
jgi:hypothetical protein